MYYRADEIAEIIDGEIVLQMDEPEIITELVIDSRKLTSPDHSVFFAIKSHRNDGHRFINDLYQKGVRNFVVSTVPENPERFHPSNIILAEDTVKALQQLATRHREKFSIPVLAITGSNGKTIVKEWIYQLISKDMNVLRSPKSYNSQIGVPLSVWQLHPDHQIAVFEAGISQPGEMKALKRIINPSTGIFTNIGAAHDENFRSRQQKIKEKLVLFRDADLLIFCRDFQDITREIEQLASGSKVSLFSWGSGKDADLRILSTKKDNSSTTLSVRFHSREFTVKIPFIDRASIENACHCMAFMLSRGYTAETVAERMPALSPIAMRLEMKEGINGCYIINDSYNSDVNSLGIALDFMKQQKHVSSQTVILSDILQSGMSSKSLYAEVSALLRKKGISRLIGIGPEISSQAMQFQGMTTDFFLSTEEFMEQYPLSSFSNEIILLKGARVFTFEKIGRLLQQKAHETVLQIDLDALIHNLNYYRSRIHPSTKVMAMVKAFSYGSGSFEIANVLQYHHADYLAVAYADEGIELRKAGITLPIMVMNPDRESMEAFLTHHLEPEIYNFRTLNLLKEAINGYNGNIKEPIPVHIKLDTGMHRLGFEEKDIPGLLKHIKDIPETVIRSVFSHLAASEDPSHDAFSNLQIRRFQKTAGMIQSCFNHRILLHMVNSAGINRFPEAHFDMVRLGISLYGITSNAEEALFLKNVSTLKSTVSQIKQIKAHESVGYNRAFQSDKEMTIAVVPVGYADGLSRTLSNGRGRLWINGHLAPVVGNICMDMTMIDITHIPAREGDEVIIFGEERSITELAREMGTIPYEVLSGISRRVKRVYFQE